MRAAATGPLSSVSAMLVSEIDAPSVQACQYWSSPAWSIDVPPDWQEVGRAVPAMP